ncbi:MAG: hypothetical protein V5A23_03090 [Halobacteriales archaeon]
MVDFDGVREAVADIVEQARNGRRADPAAFGFSEEAFDAIVAGALGDTVTRDRLLGPAAEAPLIEHLHDGEQPHHAVPGSRFVVEMDGDEMTADSGYLIATDERFMFLLYSGLTVGHNEVQYDHVEAIGRPREGGEVTLTVRTPARTLRLWTDDDRWGNELEAALDFILDQQPS